MSDDDLQGFLVSVLASCLGFVLGVILLGMFLLVGSLIIF